MTRNILLIITFYFSFFCHLFSSPKIDAKSAILIDYNSGKILHELEADMSIYPASMTKIMTSIIAFDLLKNLSPSTSVLKKRYVMDKIFSSSGVASGIDLSLKVVEIFYG